MTLSFSDALIVLKKGGKVARTGWNGKNMWIALKKPAQYHTTDEPTLPFLYIEYPHGHPAYPDGSRCPWLASQTDILAEDWQVVS